MLRSRLTIIITCVVMSVLQLTYLHAQNVSDIEIARPLDGATVREKVRIIVPGRCVPQGGFVAYFIDGRFRAAVSNPDENGGSYVYVWDTKAEETDPSLTPEQRKPREGKHTIKVQALDAGGKKTGKSKEITVYVKNKAELPPGGIRLQYKLRQGMVVDYKYSITASLKSIQGATELANTVGQAFEGSELIVRRSVEDARPDGTFLIRQKPIGTIKLVQGGRSVPAPNLNIRAAYDIEDLSGRVSYIMGSNSPGLLITVDLPNFPSSRLVVGDTWTSRDKVIRDVLTGESLVLNTHSTLEGAEWHNGYPCAKIVTTFEGIGRSPFPTVLKGNSQIKGETITYFAYQVGKLISSMTTATITAETDSASVSALAQQITSGSSYASSVLSGASLGVSSSTGGPGGFEEPPPPLPTTSGPSFSVGTRRGTTTTQSSVQVVFEVKQSLELAR
ncbi:MAG: hypothetical protein K6T99_09035 [Armatimonadetes bacterium]|nr:hypothetical protein [Armatimonadota bacterium]